MNDKSEINHTEKQSQLWNEYQSLRSEMMQADVLNYQTIGGLIAVSAGILTAAFNQTDPFLRFFIFLCIFSVTYPVYRLLQGNRRRIWRISTYMRKFLEPDLLYIKWETRLSKSRQLKSEGERFVLSSLVGINEWAIITLINIIAWLGATSSLIQIWVASTHLWIFCMVGIFVVFGIFCCLIAYTYEQEKQLRRLEKVEKDFEKSWLAVETDELSKNP